MIKHLWERYMRWCEAYYEFRKHYYRNTDHYSRWL